MARMGCRGGVFCGCCMWEFPKIRGTFCGGSRNKDYTIQGSIFIWEATMLFLFLHAFCVVSKVMNATAMSGTTSLRFKDLEGHLDAGIASIM